MQSLIRTALKNNYDVRIAATRVLQAQAQLGITRADQFPSVGAGGNITSQQEPAIGPIPAYEVTQGSLTASASWNPDFWGKYRRATEAARANLLANEWAAESSHLNSGLRRGGRLLHPSAAGPRTGNFEAEPMPIASESLELTQTLEQHGINSLLDVRQSEQLVYTAATEIPDLERQIAQEENAISILLGKNPGDIPRGLKLTEQPHSPEVPAGLPSALLERRPDIREAEAESGCCQCADRGRQGGLLSADFADRYGRIRESIAHESLHRPGGSVESSRIVYSANLRRGEAQVRRATLGSAA